ncbi:MAG: hypothetical protein M1450_02880 [Patescibacteria group bacterium]|nr:hypothetical protein [Patescibacteria group bacterium]
MKNANFENWLNQLKIIWESKNYQEIVNIVADKFAWHETPFQKPYTTKEELVNDWKTILDQDNIKVDYQILSVQNDLGLAQWSASFDRLSSKEKAELSGIFAVKLNKEGKCTEFCMWFNSKQNQK